jgi:hypothetical protein
MSGTLDPLQFAYRSKRSTEDAISIAIHKAVTNLEKRNTYVRMQFMDFSSEFKTNVPATRDTKLRALGQGTTLCNWILDFLTGRPQVARIGNNAFSTQTLNTGAHQGCVLSPLLYSRFTHDCGFARHQLHYVCDTMVVGLISNNESAYREEVSELCHDNLSLNVSKTNTTRQEGATASILPKAAEEICHAAPGFSEYYRCATESILTGCTTAWYGPPAGGEDSSVHPWNRAPTHPVHLLNTVSEEGHATSSRTQHTSFSHPYRRVDGIGA